MECEHHKYVTAAADKMEQRMQEMEKMVYTISPLVSTLCNEITDLTASINALIETNQKQADNWEKRMDNMEINIAVQSMEVKTTKDNVKEVRGWIIGATTTLLLTLLGWVVWWCQSHDIIKGVIG